MKISNRIGSMLLDHLIMTLVVAIVSIPLLTFSFFLKRYFNFEFNWILGFIMFLVYLNKDILRAKSPAKRIVGLQVIDNSTGRKASKLKCFIRNLTCVLLSIEILITLFSKQRRLGDLIANTKIVVAEKEPIGNIIAEIKTLHNNGYN